MTNGKTFLENTIIFDKGLSLEAIGLYAILKHYSTISDFQIRREHIKSVSGYGETAFRRVWKELKGANLLLEHKKRINGKFEYEFILSAEQDSTTKESKKPKKKQNKKASQKVNFEILDGQVAVEEALQEVEVKESSLVDDIIEITGCTPEVAQASVDYAKAKDAKNLKAYAIASINNGFTGASASCQDNTYRGNYTSNNSKRIPFVDDCCSRNRSAEEYAEIEAKLLGWYNDESEEAEEIQESTAYDFLKKYGIGSAIAN